MGGLSISLRRGEKRVVSRLSRSSAVEAKWCIGVFSFFPFPSCSCTLLYFWSDLSGGSLVRRASILG